MIFVASASFAQTSTMTKAQVLGLKSSTPVYNVPANHTSVSTVYLEEGFDVDGDFPPGSWTQDITNADYTWFQGNNADNNFNEIDPNSLFSALCPWVAEDTDEWLLTPVIPAPNEGPLTLNFWAGLSGPWIANATLTVNVSTDGGATWEELWDASDIIDPAASWGWAEYAVDLSDYAFDDFIVGFRYYGNDGDLCGLDGVSIEAGYEYIYQTDFEEFTVGTQLAESDESGFWTTWSDDPGSAEDAYITDEESASPTNSAIIEGVNDMVFKMGDKTSGEYAFEIDYFIPSGFGGYINVQHFESPGIEWAFEAYFGATDGNENGYMYAGDPAEQPFTFMHDEWMTLTFVFDLDIDSAAFLIDDVLLAEWQFSLQAQGDPGTLQLGGMNIFAGAPGTDTPKYYIDNVGYIVIDPGVQSAIIDVTPTSIFTSLEQGQTETDMFTIGNSGQEDLEFEIVTVYPQDGKSANVQEAKGTHTPKSLYQTPEFSSTNTTADAPSSRDELLHYDGENVGGAIGSSGGDYEWRVAAMFPADIVAPYIGMEINQIHVFINDPGIAYTAQIYDMGSFNTPGPGDLIMEQDFTATPYGWNIIDLDTPVAIDGQNIWVGYWVSSTMNSYTPGTDEGPADPNGDWIAFGPGWGHLSDNPDLNYNWNIRANLTGEPIIQWLSTDIDAGIIGQDLSTDIEVTIDANGLEPEMYTGKFYVRNNDPMNEEVHVSVTLGVTVGVNELGENVYVAVYPNPASTILHLNTNGNITKVNLVNTIGQVVYSSANGNDIDISQLERGVYFVNVETESGTTTQKVLVQ